VLCIDIANDVFNKTYSIIYASLNYNWGANFRLCAASPRAHYAGAPSALRAFHCDPGRRRRDAGG
jgi:hypothetical protein